MVMTKSEFMLKAIQLIESFQHITLSAIFKDGGNITIHENHEVLEYDVFFGPVTPSIEKCKRCIEEYESSGHINSNKSYIGNVEDMLLFLNILAEAEEISLSNGANTFTCVVSASTKTSDPYMSDIKEIIQELKRLRQELEKSNKLLNQCSYVTAHGQGYLRCELVD